MANYRLKLARVNSLKLRVSTRIPANLIGNEFITITRGANGEYDFNVDYTVLNVAPFSDPSQVRIAYLDLVSGEYRTMTVSELISGGGSGALRIVTEAGDITVGANVRLLIMNRSVDETPSKVNLPASALKVGNIKVVDWKGNAGTYPHDVYPNGSEKMNGNQSKWQIGADGASVVFDPVSSLGYAV